MCRQRFAPVRGLGLCCEGDGVMLLGVWGTSFHEHSVALDALRGQACEANDLRVRDMCTRSGSTCMSHAKFHTCGRSCSVPPDSDSSSKNICTRMLFPLDLAAAALYMHKLSRKNAAGS